MHLINDAGVAVVGYESSTDTLDLVGSGSASREHGGLSRLNSDRQQLGVLLLQEPAGWWSMSGGGFCVRVYIYMHTTANT